MAWERDWERLPPLTVRRMKYEHHFVGYWIENSAQRRLLIKTAGEEAVQSICDSGHHKRHQRPNKRLIKEQRDKDWNQRHPKDGQHVWQGDNPRGHRMILDFRFEIADWVKHSRWSVNPSMKQIKPVPARISHDLWMRILPHR